MERIIPIGIEGNEILNQNVSMVNEGSIISLDSDTTTSSTQEISINVEACVENKSCRTLPNYNVPEKIIIVLDHACDENITDFEMNSGKKYTPLFMLQHALKIFLHSKSSIDSKHEYALMLLNANSATWVHSFTNSPQDILASLEGIIETPCEPEDIFNLNTIFNLIKEEVELCPSQEDVPPAYVVRVILLYGRSYSIPQLQRTMEIEELLSSPYFIVDVIMTHEPPDSANHCERIFKALQQIDIKGYGYSFSVSRNASDLHCAMAKILSHPLQRIHQQDINYDMSSLELCAA